MCNGLCIDTTHASWINTPKEIVLLSSLFTCLVCRAWTRRIYSVDSISSLVSLVGNAVVIRGTNPSTIYITCYKIVSLSYILLLIHIFTRALVQNIDILLLKVMTITTFW